MVIPLNFHTPPYAFEGMLCIGMIAKYMRWQEMAKRTNDPQYANYLRAYRAHYDRCIDRIKNLTPEMAPEVFGRVKVTPKIIKVLQQANLPHSIIRYAQEVRRFQLLVKTQEKLEAQR